MSSAASVLFDAAVAACATAVVVGALSVESIVLNKARREREATGRGVSAGEDASEAMLPPSLVRMNANLDHSSTAVVSEPMHNQDERTRRAFFRWHMAMCCTWLAHSVMLFNPFEPMVVASHALEGASTSQQWLMNAIGRDKLALVNAIHAGFVIASAFRLVETRKSNYWYFLFVPHLLSSVYNLTVCCILWLAMLRFASPALLPPAALAAWQLFASLNCLIWTQRVWPALNIPHSDTAVPSHDPLASAAGPWGAPLTATTFLRPEDTHGARLQRNLHAWISLQLGWFAVGTVALFLARAHWLFSSTDQEADAANALSTSAFVQGFVSGYTGILHLSVVCAFGLQGARYASQPPLEFYRAAAVLYGGMHLWEALLTASRALEEGGWLWASATYLLLQAGIGGMGSLFANRMIRHLGVRVSSTHALVEGGRGEAGADLMDMRHTRDAVSAKLNLVLLGWWHLECCLLLFSAPEGMAAVPTGAVAWNLSVHGVFVYMISTYRAAVAPTAVMLQRRLRLYFTLYSMFALLSVAQSADLLWRFWPMWTAVDRAQWAFLAFSVGRAVLSLVAATYLIWLSVQHTRTHHLQPMHRPNPPEPAEQLSTSLAPSAPLSLEATDIFYRDTKRERLVMLLHYLFAATALVCVWQAHINSDAADPLMWSTHAPLSRFGAHSVGGDVIFHFAVVTVGLMMSGLRQQHPGYLAMARAILVPLALLSFSSVLVQAASLPSASAGLASVVVMLSVGGVSSAVHRSVHGAEWEAREAGRAPVLRVW